jgi:hypothetical protein
MAVITGLVVRVASSANTGNVKKENVRIEKRIFFIVVNYLLFG